MDSSFWVLFGYYGQKNADGETSKTYDEITSYGVKGTIGGFVITISYGH